MPKTKKYYKEQKEREKKTGAADQAGSPASHRDEWFRTALESANLIPRVVGRYSPLVVDHGEGIYVWDVDGERYAGLHLRNRGRQYRSLPSTRGRGDPGAGRQDHPRAAEHPGA